MNCLYLIQYSFHLQQISQILERRILHNSSNILYLILKHQKYSTMYVHIYTDNKALFRIIN